MKARREVKRRVVGLRRVVRVVRVVRVRRVVRVVRVRRRKVGMVEEKGEEEVAAMEVQAAEPT